MYRKNLEGCVLYLTHNSIVEGSDDLGDIPTLGRTDSYIVLCTPESLEKEGYKIPFPNRGDGGQLVLKAVFEAGSPLTKLEPRPFMHYFDFWMEKVTGIPVYSVGCGLYPNAQGYIEPHSMKRYDILSKRIDGGIKQLQLKLKEFVDEGIPVTGTELYEYFRVSG